MSRHRNHFDFSDDDLGIDIEQQSDSDIAPPAVHTPPPAQKGMIISKLGVQATTGDGVATGLLCLKVSLSRLRAVNALRSFYSSSSVSWSQLTADYAAQGLRPSRPVGIVYGRQ